MQLWAAAGARSPIRGQQEAGCGDDEGESDLPSMVQWALGFREDTRGATARKSTDGQVPPDDHTKLICSVALWVYPLAAHPSFFVCARKLALKCTSLPEAQPRAVPSMLLAPRPLAGGWASRRRSPQTRAGLPLYY